MAALWPIFSLKGRIRNLYSRKKSRISSCCRFSFAPWSSSMYVSIEIQRSSSFSTSAAARKFPLWIQMRISVSNSTKSISPEVSDHRINHFPGLAHVEERMIGYPPAAAGDMRSDYSFHFPVIQDGYLLIAINGFKNLTHPITQVYNRCFHPPPLICIHALCIFWRRLSRKLDKETAGGPLIKIGTVSPRCGWSTQGTYFVDIHPKPLK
jgi:hypothetical protein